MGVVAMLIECGSCRARYRIKTSMLKGFKGAEVRCRKCGGTIVVLTAGSDSATPGPVIRGERRASSRRSLSAKGKAARAVGDEMVPPVRSARGLEQREAGAQADKALPEEPGSDEYVPDNVFQLGLFREAAPEQPPSEPYDISGQIRMDPVVSPARKGLAWEFPHPPAPPPERRDPADSILPEEPVTGEKEAGDSMPVESLIPSQDPTEIPEESSSGRSRVQSSYSYSAPRPSHVAIVYLLLLLLGGCGYLLVRFLANIASGGA